jgi:uncharacterized membrane protein
VREWLLFVHILSAVVYLGGAITVTIQATGAAAMPGQFLKMADLAGRAIGIGAVFTLLSGLALVVESDVWDFSMTFVAIGIGGLLIAGAVEGMYSRKRVAAVEIAIDEEGPEADSVGAGIRRVMSVNVVLIGLLVFVLWAMVFKPGA